MANNPLEEDAYRLIDELWPLMSCPSDVGVTIDTEPDEEMSGGLKFRRGGLDIIIGLNPAHVTTGELLYVNVLHELLHFMDRENLQRLHALGKEGGLPMYALHLLTEAEECFVQRLERFISKIHPCPEWLKEKTYSPQEATMK